MNPTVYPTLIGRLAPRARRGSLVVTSFIVIVGMAAIVGGIHQMLKSQIDQSFEIQRISFARLQATYLAEMGVNHVMFVANKANVPASANPWSAISLGTAAGSAVSLDFKDKVAMTRGVANATANCVVTRLNDHASPGPNSFRVIGTLVVPNVGTYTKQIDFAAQYDSVAPEAWELSSYQVY